MKLPTKIEKGWMDKYRRANALPKRMSMLVYLTLADVRKARRMKGVEINMDDWAFRCNKICYVCAGGAVAMMTLKKFKAHQGSIDFLVNLDLHCIDYLRTGKASSAANLRGLSRRKYAKYDRDITHYEDNPAQWEREFRQLGDDMYADGL